MGYTVRQCTPKTILIAWYINEPDRRQKLMCSSRSQYQRSS